MRTWRSAAAGVAALVLLVTACGGGDGGEAAGGGGEDLDSLAGEVHGAGATFPAPLFRDWTFQYGDAVQPDVRISYDSIGSGGGIDRFLEGSVEFGSSERYLTDEDLDAVATMRGCAGIQFPVVFGSVVIAFNDVALDGMVLDAETIAGIFSGEITTYQDPALRALNPDMDLPDREIVPVHRADGSGTTYVFTRYLSHEVASWESRFGFGTEVAWPEGSVAGPGNEGVFAEVLRNRGGVGYLNQSYALENDMAQAAVVNESGTPVYPTLETTTTASDTATIPDDYQFDILDIGGDGFPITGTNWIFAYECGYDGDTAAILRDFWTWATGSEEADLLALDLGYAPMGPELKERVRAEIARINIEGV